MNTTSFLNSKKHSSHLTRPAVVALSWVTTIALALLAAPALQAQTFTVLHSFTGGVDGNWPAAGLTMDAEGNLYGTTEYGGHEGVHCDGGACGTVFKLTRRGSTWVLNSVYEFKGGLDGKFPVARVVFGPDGRLYGTTSRGGGSGYGGEGNGTVFSLTPPATVCKSAVCPWAETIVYRFGGADGDVPNGEVVFDQTGNIYSTTQGGGGLACNCGVVYKLTPSNGSWTEHILYSFTGAADGASPNGTLIFDSNGSLYGTTLLGGGAFSECSGGCGTVYELTPSGSGWTENTLYAFQDQDDGAFPVAGLIFDQEGNLYGAASTGEVNNGGTVFELTHSSGNWTFLPLFSFPSMTFGSPGPQASLVMDAAGNLYGTTLTDGAYGEGSAFKLSNGSLGWTQTVLHDFTGGSDGAVPFSNLVFDTSGNLYGTAAGGGTGAGVVFEIML
jgi:uncharacterized repeat protein (TIGR03803 family)